MFLSSFVKPVDCCVVFAQVTHKNKKSKKKLVRKKGFDTQKSKARSTSARPSKKAVKGDKRSQKEVNKKQKKKKKFSFLFCP